MSLERFLFGTDLHGDRQDAATVKAFLAFDALWKPHIRVFGGDLVDLRPLRKGCSKEERRESMRADIDAGRAFLKRYRPNYYLRGNHCERLWETARDLDGPTADLAQMGCEDMEHLCRSLKIKMLPYHKRKGVLRIGHLKMLHGFGKGGVTATRKHAFLYGSILMGHIHTIDEAPIPGLERRVARAVGCLCDLDMDYDARNPDSLRHAHGWAYGVINSKTGSYHVWQAEEIDGQWLLPTEIKAIG